MANLYTIHSAKSFDLKSLTPHEVSAVIYHDLFDYPLNFADLIKWRTGEPFANNDNFQISDSRGYWHVEGKEGLVFKRILRKRISERKIEIAKRASKVISLIPSVKFVGITGSLAMQNSAAEGDIDLMIITKANTLWSTRLAVYMLTRLFGLSFRKPNDLRGADKLCLNMWLDESDLEWKRDRNLYTAHEIAQIVPLVNKNKVYENFLIQNRWILNFWPNAIKIRGKKGQKPDRHQSLLSYFLVPLENLAYKLQYSYMQGKITRETITPTRALFHPQDWGKVVLDRLAPLS